MVKKGFSIWKALPVMLVLLVSIACAACAKGHNIRNNESQRLMWIRNDGTASSGYGNLIAEEKGAFYFTTVQNNLIEWKSGKVRIVKEDYSFFGINLQMRDGYLYYIDMGQYDNPFGFYRLNPQSAKDELLLDLSSLPGAWSGSAMSWWVDDGEYYFLQHLKGEAPFVIYHLDSEWKYINRISLPEEVSEIYCLYGHKLVYSMELEMPLHRTGIRDIGVFDYKTGDFGIVLPYDREKGLDITGNPAEIYSSPIGFRNGKMIIQCMDDPEGFGTFLLEVDLDTKESEKIVVDSKREIKILALNDNVTYFIKPAFGWTLEGGMILCSYYKDTVYEIGMTNLSSYGSELIGDNFFFSDLKAYDKKFIDAEQSEDYVCNSNCSNYFISYSNGMLYRILKNE